MIINCTFTKEMITTSEMHCFLNLFYLFKTKARIPDMYFRNWYHYTPSHPTPASAEWRQLCDRIGLLGHSSSWVELEVHWTSSRKIGPLPAPK